MFQLKRIAINQEFSLGVAGSDFEEQFRDLNGPRFKKQEPNQKSSDMTHGGKEESTTSLTVVIINLVINIQLPLSL